MPFTVPGWPGLARVLCLQMILPWIASVPQYRCVSEYGPPGDETFSPASCSDEASEEVEGRILEPYDGSFCRQYDWYTWQSGEYPRLGVTVCLGSPG